MPFVADHVRQAEHNEAVYDYLAQGDQNYGDWQITILFYSSLHYVNAYLRLEGEEPRDHNDRQLRIFNSPALRALVPEYSELRDRCWEARYRAVTFSPDRVHSLYRGVFRPLRTQIRALLNLAQ